MARNGCAEPIFEPGSVLLWVFLTKKVFDVHLMIAPADPYIEAFAKAGADVLTLHAEAGVHLDRSLQVIRGLPDVGYPLSVAVVSDQCVPFEVTAVGRPTQRRVVSFGAGRCRA